MRNERIITMPEGIELDAGTVLYVSMNRNYAEFHMIGGEVMELRVTMAELEKLMGPDFIKIHRSTLVSIRAIHNVTDTVNLSNGEQLNYTSRKKEQVQSAIQRLQRELLQGLPGSNLLVTQEDYREHYRAFDNLPFAFTDIEMVFNEQSSAVDWILRYGNPALAELEKLPLETLIGASFGSLFANMDSKWLRSYERSALFGETLEIIDYSPEIDTYLKVISFPTFPGHCGCILFNINDLRFANTYGDSEKALLKFLGRMAQG